MRVCEQVRCQDFPCAGVNQAAYAIPSAPLAPEHVKLVLISEAAPAAAADGYDGGETASHVQSTLTAFRSAGLSVASMPELYARGVYLTNAIKCGKVGYAVPSAAINSCAALLERELDLFPNVRACLLMGDVAIKACNALARRRGEPRPIPAGATYKLRGGVYWFRGQRAFPSYLQAGPSYGIEKSKVAMIAADIAAALEIAAIR